MLRASLFDRLRRVNTHFASAAAVAGTRGFAGDLRKQANYIYYDDKGRPKAQFENAKRDADYERSINDQEGYFAEVAAKIHWYEPY